MRFANLLVGFVIVIIIYALNFVNIIIIHRIGVQWIILLLHRVQKVQMQAVKTICLYMRLILKSLIAFMTSDQATTHSYSSQNKSIGQ